MTNRSDSMSGAPGPAPVAIFETRSDVEASIVRGLLESHGVPAHTATSISHLPPISVLFAAFLGYNPVARLVPVKPGSSRQLRETIARLKEFSRGQTLGGLKIKDLINEGRR